MLHRVKERIRFVDNRFYSVVVIGTLILMIFFIGGLRGLFSWLGYLLVIFVILKLVPNPKMKLLLILVLVGLMLLVQLVQLLN